MTRKGVRQVRKCLYCDNQVGEFIYDGVFKAYQQTCPLHRNLHIAQRKPKSTETKRKMSEARKRRLHKPLSIEHRKHLSEVSLKGDKCKFWRGGKKTYICENCKKELKAIYI